jgi:hypothetical protein
MVLDARRAVDVAARVAQRTKNRFGHVGSGSKENQLSHTANSFASVPSTGSLPSAKPVMTRPDRVASVIVR